MYLQFCESVVRIPSISGVTRSLISEDPKFSSGYPRGVVDVSESSGDGPLAGALSERRVKSFVLGACEAMHLRDPASGKHEVTYS